MRRITALLLCALSVISLSGFSAGAGSENSIDDPSAGNPDLSPEWVEDTAAAANVYPEQILVVACDGMNKSTASLSMHRHTENGTWEQIIAAPAFVGRNGLCPDADRYEGCGKTPIGMYTFNMAFGTADDPGCAIPYVKVDKYKYWSGDMREGMYYNQMVDIRELPGLDKKSSEHLLSNRYEYKYCLNISFNAEGTPGRGSAIFLHCASRRPQGTFGCVAVQEKYMKLIMQKVRPGCMVVIDTLENLTASTVRESRPDIDYGISSIFTREDMDAALNTILSSMDGRDGCQLQSICYTGDEENKPENLAWLNSLGEGHAFTECISFLGSVCLLKEPAGESSRAQENAQWQWWLGRTGNGEWELLTWGWTNRVAGDAGES